MKHVWTSEENERFLAGLKTYGEKGIKEIAEYIGTRNAAQVRSHLQKYKLKHVSKTKDDGKGKSEGDKSVSVTSAAAPLQASATPGSEAKKSASALLS